METLLSSILQRGRASCPRRHPCYQVTLQVRREALERGPEELLAKDAVQTGKAVGNHQPDLFNAPVPKVIEHITPARATATGARPRTRSLSSERCLTCCSAHRRSRRRPDPPDTASPPPSCTGVPDTFWGTVSSI